MNMTEMKISTSGEIIEYINPGSFISCLHILMKVFGSRTDCRKVCEQGVHISPHLVWNCRLKERFFSRGLCEPRPDGGDVEKAQVLEENTSAEAEGLDDEVVEKVVCRFGEIVS